MRILLNKKAILFGIIVLCAMLFAVAIYQFILINQKQARLNSLQVASAELQKEIENARETLEIVSSKEYQELQARKRGFGYEGERRFLAE